ncbi:hypothetical protein D3C73_1015470 [compost metagenome]
MAAWSRLRERVFSSIRRQNGASPIASQIFFSISRVSRSTSTSIAHFSFKRSVSCSLQNSFSGLSCSSAVATLPWAGNDCSNAAFNACTTGRSAMANHGGIDACRASALSRSPVCSTRASRRSAGVKGTAAGAALGVVAGMSNILIAWGDTQFMKLNGQLIIRKAERIWHRPNSFSYASQH